MLLNRGLLNSMLRIFSHIEIPVRFAAVASTFNLQDKNCKIISDVIDFIDSLEQVIGV